MLPIRDTSWSYFHGLSQASTRFGQGVSFFQKGTKDMILGQVVYLENETKSESASELTKAISDNQVRVLGFYTHSKASEKYVVISIARARS